LKTGRWKKQKKWGREKINRTKVREYFFYFRQGTCTLLCLPEANFFSRACVWQA